jgi:aspartate aminotransferase-like enzyme
MLTAVLAVRNETPSGPAREVSNGAIIFRAGDKHYLVDANPRGEP